MGIERKRHKFGPSIRGTKKKGSYKAGSTKNKNLYYRWERDAPRSPYVGAGHELCIRLKEAESR